MGLGNGVYKSGSKGSNFSFELKTLKALEQIAILIEAGGSVPGSQNLQQVTTLGNTTTNEIITSGPGLRSENGASYGRMTWQGLELELYKLVLPSHMHLILEHLLANKYGSY